MGLTRAVIPATGSDKGEFPNLPENIQTTEPAYHAEFRMEMLHSFSFDAGGTIDVVISKCKSLPSMQNASRGKHRAAARKRCKCARAATSCPTRDAVSPRSAYQIRRECAGAAADLFFVGMKHLQAYHWLSSDTRPASGTAWL